jgi:glycosyltransferase involved in cell wall biosynthesis
VLVCHDLFPDLAVALGRLRNPVIEWGWSRLNRLVRTRATRIIVVGRDMEERLRSQGVEPAKLVFIPAWSERQPVDRGVTEALRTEHGWEGKFVVMHAGNLGMAQNVAILAELADRVRHAPDVLIAVLGGGQERPTLERMVRERRLGNVQFLDGVPRPRAQALMAAADLHVISLAPGLWGCAAPSKTYGIMAAGRPFVAAVDAGSEPDLIAGELGCGWRVPAGDAGALAEATLALRDERLDEMGERGRRGFEQTYVRERLTDRTARVLEAVVADRPLPSRSEP